MTTTLQRTSAIFLALIALFLLAGCTDRSDTNVTINPPTDEQQEQNDYTVVEPTDAEAEGSVVIGITDAAFDAESYQNFEINIDDIALYTESEGWVSVDVQQEKTDLLELKNATKHHLLAHADIAADSYTQIRFDLDDAEAKTSAGESIEFDTTQEVILPLDITVDEQANTYVLIDVELDKSKIESKADEDDDDGDDDEWVFEPYITVSSTTNARIETKEDTTSRIRGAQQIRVSGDASATTKTEASFSIPFIESTILTESTFDASGDIASDDDQADEEADTTGSAEANAGVGVDVEVITGDAVDTDIDTTLTGELDSDGEGDVLDNEIGGTVTGSTDTEVEWVIE